MINSWKSTVNISEIQNFLHKQKGIKESLEQRISDNECRVKKYKRDLKNLEDAGIILKAVAQQTQEELQYRISEIVTLALNSVFEDDWTFNIDFVFKRGKTEADIYLEKNNEKYHPMDDMGGGIVDVISFALRIMAWTLQNPQSNNCIILDEPFRFLSKELQINAGNMLQELSKKLQLQFIMVTHESALIDCANKVFTVTQKNGVSEVVCV
jgi:DNA repair exonuclease SbcCD ATPase subunit